MKKAILFFTLATFLLTSCSSDDGDNSSSSQDLLIGTWTWYQSFFNGEEQSLDDCDKMDTIVINSDGTFNESYFYDDNGTCVSDGTDSGTWQNLGNNVYRTVYGAGTPDEETLDQTILFEGNTFYIEEVDGQFSFKIVYIRN
jgi:hypothetical protein